MSLAHSSTMCEYTLWHLCIPYTRLYCWFPRNVGDKNPFVLPFCTQKDIYFGEPQLSSQKKVMSGMADCVVVFETCLFWKCYYSEYLTANVF